jgi:hypothetical protein
MKKLHLVLFTLFFVFGGITAVMAQDIAPEAVEPLAADAPAQKPMGTAISYQGQLRNAGGPVNGVCDMTFQIFDAQSAGAVMAAPIATPVTVTNGLFVTALDFGAAAFNGEARWLEIGVKCAGDPGFTTLSPRQAIAPAPYALALPGMRTEQNTISSNVIGGSVSNTVSAGVRGAVISGGGNANVPNLVASSYSVVGGGIGNTASGSAATVSGGSENMASGGAATVSGGYENTASDFGATVSGGEGNTASSDESTVSGGRSNTASGFASTIPGGRFALASNVGQMAYAAGAFAATGDAQMSMYVLKTEVPTGHTSGELISFFSHLTISNTRTLAFDILIVARSNAGESSGWRYQGVIENNNGTTAFIGTPAKTTLGEDDPVWDVDLIVDDAIDALVIKGFTNQSGDTVRFVATVRTVEVAW